MYNYRAKVIRCVDGDTVDFDVDLGFKIFARIRTRLIGVDTPESRTRDLVEKKYGLAAKSFVESHLPVGSKQTLQTKLDDRGKFGRILGEFVVEQEWEGKTLYSTINEQLIKKHHGVKYHGQSKDDIEAEHLENREKVIL